MYQELDYTKSYKDEHDLSSRDSQSSGVDRYDNIHRNIIRDRTEI